MGEHFAGGGSVCGVQTQEGREKGGPSVGEEGKAGSNDGAGGLGCGGEAEGAGVGEAFEARPDCFGGDAAEFEDLGGMV